MELKWVVLSRVYDDYEVHQEPYQSGLYLECDIIDDVDYTLYVEVFDSRIEALEYYRNVNR